MEMTDQLPSDVMEESKAISGVAVWKVVNFDAV